MKFDRMTASKVLAGSFALVFTGLSAGCHRDPLKVASSSYEKGQQYERVGKTNEAILEYRRAEQNNSRLYEAHLHLAKIYTARGDFNNGGREVKMLHDLRPEDLDGKNLLAQYLVMGRQYGDALKITKDVLAQEPDNLPALLTEAKASLGLQDIQKAGQDVATALQLDPKNTDAYLLKAGIQQAAGKNADSEDTLKKALQLAPSNFSALELLVSSYLSRQDPKDAGALLSDYVGRFPDDMLGQVTLGKFYWSQGRLPEAEQQFRHVSEVGEKSPQYRATVAEFYLRTHRFDEAVKAYRQILTKHSDDYANRRGLATAYLIMDKKDEAKKEIEAVLHDHPSDVESLFLRGRLRALDNYPDGAIQDLQRVSQLLPNSAQPHYWLALLFIDQNNNDRAKAELQSALQLDSTLVPARLLLAQLQNRQGERKSAIDQLDKIIEQQPSDPRSYLMKADLQAESGDLSGAEKTLDPILAQDNTTVSGSAAYDALAALKVREQNYPEARVAAEKSLKIFPRSQKALSLIALTYVAEKQPDKALERIAQQLATQPDWVEGYNVQGQFLLRAKRLPEAQQALEHALSLNPNLTMTHLLLGETLTAEGKLDDAIKVYAESNDPRMQATVHLHIAQAHEMKQEWNDAQTEYNKVLQISPDDVVAKNNLAWMLLKHGGDVDTALKLAQEARSAAPNSPNVADTLAMIYMAKNSYGNAVQLLQDSVKKDPSNASFEYHLGMAYAKDGRRPEAVAALRNALKLNPSNADAQDAKDLLKQVQ